MKLLHKNSWKYSHFPELYIKTTSTPLCKYISKKNLNNQVKLIIIHHLHKAGYSYIKSLKSSYHINLIIGIPYSSLEEIKDKLEKENLSVIIPKSLSEIKYLVENHIKKSNQKDKFIIVEIGGYTSEISTFLDKNNKVLGVVEDTRNGYWLWKNKIIKRLPILSIADSELKSKEDPYVGKAIVDGLEKYLFLTKRIKLQKRNILVIGFGNIGSQVAKFIKPLCKDLLIFDINSNKLNKAQELNFKTLSIEDYKNKSSLRKIIKNYDIIIGVTGNPSFSIGEEILTSISNNTILVSGSSKRIEIDIDFLKRNSKFNVQLRYDLKFVYNKNNIYVSNFGEPINHSFSKVPSSCLDLTYSALIFCINKIASGYKNPGLKKISFKEQEKLILFYKSMYF